MAASPSAVRPSLHSPRAQVETLRIRRALPRQGYNGPPPPSSVAAAAATREDWIVSLCLSVVDDVVVLDLRST